MAGELRTYGDPSIVTDVQKEIELLTPQENLLLRSLQKTTALSEVHQWQDDTLASAGSSAVTQYKAFTPDTLSVPTLRTNLIEQVYRAGSVTEAQQKVAHFSGKDEYSRQVTKQMINWSNAAEFDLLRSSLVSGASGTTSRMNGVINTLTTNTTAHTSGTVFSESVLIGLLKQTWDNSSGDTTTDLLVGSILKTKISGFTTGITKYIDRDAKAAGQVVQMYESDFGTVNVHLHRYVQLSTDATARIVGMNMEKFYIAYLTGGDAKLTKYAKNATSDDFVINGYLTLENRQQVSSFFASGFLKAV